MHSVLYSNTLYYTVIHSVLYSNILCTIQYCTIFTSCRTNGSCRYRRSEGGSNKSWKWQRG